MRKHFFKHTANLYTRCIANFFLNTQQNFMVDEWQTLF